MPLIQPAPGQLIELQLARDLTRTLKRGHPWVFAEALRYLPPAPPGAHARLLDKQGRREIALGFYDPQSPLAFRVCSLDQDQKLNNAWAERQFEAALALRQALFDKNTTGFRLFNGEGDRLPGLVCDVYGDTAVIQLDGQGASHFWDAGGVGHWVAKALSLKRVYERRRGRDGSEGRPLLGTVPTEPVSFLENGTHFTIDVIRGQKTGFFLDQRENRRQMQTLAAGRRVLNVFGYTGGFSVYAGLGGARHVTTVDLAGPALEVAERHWRDNNLPEADHTVIVADAFIFLDEAAQRGDLWDLVILDPPSFAPARKAVPKALAAYRRLIAAGATVTIPQGLLAAASCSSHIDLSAFLNACEGGIAKARRRATILSISGQPPDHPAPLVLPEFRYLKFILMRLE
jgi:23S rRNA (cytosine1962-C5)-methyltransferase